MHCFQTYGIIRKQFKLDYFMALLDILRFPDARLRTKAVPVTKLRMEFVSFSMICWKPCMKHRE